MLDCLDIYRVSGIEVPYKNYPRGVHSAHHGYYYRREEDIEICKG
jgi:hypothetical protein